MNKIKTISIVALGLLLIGIVGSILTFKPMSQSMSISKEKVINETFSHVKVTTDNTEVEMLPTTDSTTKVIISGKVMKGAKYHLSTDVKNATLSINVNHERRSFISFFPSSLSLKVYVPKKMYESLQIKSDNGPINVGDLEAKDMYAKTENGKIKLKNVKGTTVTTETANGFTELKSVIASTLKVKSENGKVHLDGIEGKIIGQSSNGDISLITNQLDFPIEFETNNGGIHIQTKREPSNAMISASVENGNVNLFDRSSRNAVFGNGEHVIQLTTENGNIDVEKK